MKDHEKIPADQKLDEVLALMAEEVPPVPADFHEKWTKAVRAEAEKSETEPEKANNSRVVLINRWTRILSVAAVFVFLIGGTLVYRSSRPAVTIERPAAEKREETGKANEKPAQEDSGAVFEMEEAQEAESEAVEAPVAESYESYAAEPEEADAAMEASEAEAPMLNLSVAGAANKKAAEQMDMAAEEAVEVAAEEAAEEPVNDAAVPVPTVQMTPAPTPEPVPESKEAETVVPEAETTEAVKAETAGFGQVVGDFFRDMGAFLLTVWPYLLILAVPAGAALIWKKKKKHKG